MAAVQPHLDDWLRLIRAEFEEVPGLELTQQEVEDLWAVDAIVAEALLDALVACGHLRRTRLGTYRRGDAAVTET